MAVAKERAESSLDSADAAESFTVKDIFYEITFEELVSRGVKFNMVEHNRQKFSMFDLRPVEVNEDEMFRLMEDINEVVQYQQDVKFKKKPKKLDIVLAKKTGTQRYHRCFISNFFFDAKHYAEVFWIDVGGTGTVELNDLKPVNKDIMSHPRLAYTVILQDVCEISNYILLAEFEKEMSNFRKTDFTVELGERNRMGGTLYCKNKVKLTFKASANTIVDLKDEIDKLIKWEWETFSNLKGSDDEICSKGKWGHEFRTTFKDQLPFSYTLCPNVDRFSATVSRVITDEKNDKLANLHIILLDNQVSYNYFNVLHHQLERYVTNIKKSKFFPALKEALLFKLENKEQYKGKVKCLGRWLRAIRVSLEMIYLFDIDDFVPFTSLPKEDYDMRPLYCEFFKVPALSIVVRPADAQGPLEFRLAKEIFKEGKRFHFIVTKDNDADGSPYEVRYSKALNETEEKLTVDNFLTTYRRQ